MIRMEFSFHFPMAASSRRHFTIPKFMSRKWLFLKSPPRANLINRISRKTTSHFSGSCAKDRISPTGERDS
ncbi:hypothetical protein NXC24_CH02808 [Rhizobium sp. NXC24]|nr:hypothetical protein NXC24_CH02808 [Rhizobium sp. NXC24]